MTFWKFLHQICRQLRCGLVSTKHIIAMIFTSQMARLIAVNASKYFFQSLLRGMHNHVQFCIFRAKNNVPFIKTISETLRCDAHRAENPIRELFSYECVTFMPLKQLNSFSITSDLIFSIPSFNRLR